MKLNVAKRAPYEHEDTQGAQGGDGLTGLMAQENSPLLGLVIVASLIAAVFMLVFTRMYMIDHHNPSQAIMAYDANQVRKAAIDGETETPADTGSGSDYGGYPTSGFQAGAY